MSAPPAVLGLDRLHSGPGRAAEPFPLGLSRFFDLGRHRNGDGDPIGR
ncbi:hypothetical protein [Mesorhizobium sp. M0571]